MGHIAWCNIHRIFNSNNIGWAPWHVRNQRVSIFLALSKYLYPGKSIEKAVMGDCPPGLHLRQPCKRSSKIFGNKERSILHPWASAHYYTSISRSSHENHVCVGGSFHILDFGLWSFKLRVSIGCLITHHSALLTFFEDFNWPIPEKISQLQQSN